jgi:bifunctional oligoribonuclease and PAP phosphatase NrnA
MNDSFESIATVLTEARTIALASHMRPDGDALGSTVALALHLRAAGKEVTAWNEDGVPAKFRYLPGCEIVTAPPGRPVAFDVVVSLDNASKKRLGTVVDALADGARWINIDHHVSNERYGHLNYIDPTAPATGQILYEYFRAVGAIITPAVAGNLFAAISTDTGSFQYRGTDGRTFRAAGDLVEAGVDVAGLSMEMYDRQPRRRLELLRHALNTAVFSCGGRLATFCLSLDDVARLGVIPEDNEGIIDHLRSVEGVIAAVFFEELEGGKVRVSARSKDMRVDVCRVCTAFGGGGHPLAAGARMPGPMDSAAQKFTAALSDEILKHTD